MQSSNKTLVTVIVIIVLVVVGYFIFKGSGPAQNTPVSSSSTTTSTAAPAEKETPSQSVSAALVSASPSKVSLADVKKMFADRGTSPSDAQLAAFTKSVDAATVKTTTLDVSSCTLTPNVIGLKPTDKLTLLNKDSIPHTINYGGAAGETVGPNSTKVVTLKFPNATSASVVSGLLCDTDKADQISGIVNIQP